jgi:hypothetical protein
MQRKVYPYVPKFTTKFIGHYPINFRSSWEVSFARWLDYNENVTAWSNEKHAIPYYDPMQMKNRRYFPDFYAKIKNKNNKIIEYIIEIKPKKETRPPRKTKAQSKRTKLYQESTYITNSAKFEAAEKYCKKMGYIFKIVSEDKLFKKRS